MDAPALAYIQDMFPQHCWARLFLVGGCVRDLLIGAPGNDIDLVAALSDSELEEAGFSLVQGKSTMPIWFKSDTTVSKIEVTQIQAVNQLETDLSRRDFTINSIALGVDSTIIDPLGGREALDKRVLQVSSPLSFRSDPLRIFRAFRFEAEGWQLSEETASLIRDHDWSSDLEVIPVERFSREMLKALAGSQPDCFFSEMFKFQVGSNFLPEIFRMPGVPAGPKEHHPEGNLLVHSLQVLERIAAESSDALPRFCGFFHDLGKLTTDPGLYPKHHGHEEQGFTMADKLCRRLRLPKEYSKALAWTCRLHGNINHWQELRNSTRVRIAEQALKAGIAEILPLVSRADKAETSNLHGWLETLDVAVMSTEELGIKQEGLESLFPEQRADYILQRRVEKLARSIRTSSAERL